MKSVLPGVMQYAPVSQFNVTLETMSFLCDRIDKCKIQFMQFLIRKALEVENMEYIEMNAYSGP